MSPITWTKWDRVADLARRLGAPQPPEKSGDEGQEAGDATPAQDPAVAALPLLKKAIEEGHAPAALAIYQKTPWSPEAEPSDWDLLGLIKLLQTAGMVAESVALMEQFIGRFPDRSGAVRLKLAQVLIRDQQRPVQALRVLAGIAEGSLPTSLESARRRLEQAATRMRDEGVLELEGEGW